MDDLGQFAILVCAMFCLTFSFNSIVGCESYRLCIEKASVLECSK